VFSPCQERLKTNFLAWLDSIAMAPDRSSEPPWISYIGFGRSPTLHCRRNDYIERSLIAIGLTMLV
jgi:hypothetical protein